MSDSDLAEAQPDRLNKPWCLLSLFGCVLILVGGLTFFRRHLRPASRPLSRLQAAKLAGLEARRARVLEVLDAPERAAELAAGFEKLEALARADALSLMAYAVAEGLASTALEDGRVSPGEAAELSRVFALLHERRGALSLTGSEGRELLRSSRSAMAEGE